MFIHAMLNQFFPKSLKDLLSKQANKLMALLTPYACITFPEYPPDSYRRSDSYAAIQSYLSACPSALAAQRLLAHDAAGTKSLALSMDHHEEVADTFRGADLWWTSYCVAPERPYHSEKRFFKLSFHSRHRDLVTKEYLSHVVSEGREIAARNRRRKIYNNCKSDSGPKWSPVVFNHPASFDTMALDPKKKKEIIDDLVKFKQGKDYYAKIGKTWKRGYLLYGPPGTGKSTMIAAMAKFLDYDVYDLELTAVKDNTELRKLLVGTSNKSIIVIEDIDCSLDLTGQRSKKAAGAASDDEEEKKKKKKKKKKKSEESDAKKPSNSVTLSGLLNFIDGIWSASGSERVLVFTTNHVNKLDPALIRRGRMDKHIELSYCRFEAFKVLARNYLDVESHASFQKIEALLGEVNMTPADVAENLLPKSEDEDADACLNYLVEALERAKQEKQRKKKNKKEASERRRLEELLASIESS